jgi:hypothetical protein
MEKKKEREIELSASSKLSKAINREQFNNSTI